MQRLLTVFYILLGILIFGFLIAIHEFGHFIAAKLSGVQVNEYSINMGPKLLQTQRGETLYTLRLLPIGGYCAMEGEDEESDNPRAFNNAAWWKRLIILVAGSFMNFVAGLLIITILCAFTVKTIPDMTIHSFMDESILDEQGFELGDRFYAVDGKRVYVSSDIDLLVERHQSKIMDITVLRDGKKLTLHNVDMTKQLVTYEDGSTDYKYGFLQNLDEANFGSILRFSFYESLDFTRMVWFGLSDLIAGKVGLKDMGGPVQIVKVMADSGTSARTIADGIADVFFLGAFIAVNLAVMNMLPIPALDGGRVFLLLIGTIFTAITKKNIPSKYEGYVHAAGMVLLLGLMAVIFVKDIVQMIRP